MSATGRDPQAGATLLEMLVVVAILALIAGLTFPNLPRALDGMTLARAGADLTANLRIARADAAQRGHAVSFEIAEDGRGYGWDEARVALPPPLRIESDSRSIDFFADGTSTGGEFKVLGRVGGLGVTVDPINGVAAGKVS
jgi:general secretion pathway protein H